MHDASCRVPDRQSVFSTVQLYCTSRARKWPVLDVWVAESTSHLHTLFSLSWCLSLPCGVMKKCLSIYYHLLPYCRTTLECVQALHCCVFILVRWFSTNKKTYTNNAWITVPHTPTVSLWVSNHVFIPSVFSLAVEKCMSSMQIGTQMVKLRGGSKGLVRFFYLDEHKSCIRWRPSRKNEKAKSEWCCCKMGCSCRVRALPSSSYAWETSGNFCCHATSLSVVSPCAAICRPVTNVYIEALMTWTWTFSDDSRYCHQLLLTVECLEQQINIKFDTHTPWDGDSHPLYVYLSYNVKVFLTLQKQNPVYM